MKIAFLMIIWFHGLVHLIGFIKGFGFNEVKELKLPVSRTMGSIWLAASLLFLTYGILYALNAGQSWLTGFLAVALSQLLIILFWKDARFGTIPNILALTVSLISFGHEHFNQLIERDVSRILRQNTGAVNGIIEESDLSHLPGPVKKWLRNSGAVGRPFMHNGKVTQTAAMRMSPDQEEWLNASAIQYTTIDIPAFIWGVDVQMNSLIHFQGRDKYENGKGEMLIKLNSLINVVNEQGEKLDEGTLQRYVGEMVWFPSLALSPHITWEQTDENTARASMTYRGATGAGTFFFNENGDVLKFSALRYKGNETDARRYEWEMNITEHKTFQGIKVPAKMTSTWKLEKGDWTWLQLEVKAIEYNVDVK